VSVLAPGDLEDHRGGALAGFADAVALDEHDQPDVVLDWKSDVAPDERTKSVYREQVAQYAQALDAQRGAVVYLTSGQIDWLPT